MTRTRPPQGRQTGPVVLLTLLAVAAFWIARVWMSNGTEVQVFANYDVLAYWLPLLQQAAQQWRDAVVPLWNPNQALGTPLLATQQVGVAYPPHLLYTLLPTGSAWLAVGILHQCVASFGMYAWCRFAGIPPAAALVGGLGYSFSGIFLGKLINLPDEAACLSWAPLVALSIDRVVEVASAARAMQLAVTGALLFLGGDADTIVRAGILFASYSVFRITPLARITPRRALRTAGVLVLSATGTLGVTAFQWLPTAELAFLSVRAPGSLSAAQQVAFAADLREILLNRVRGVPGPEVGSTLPLLFAVVGLWRWEERGRARFFAAWALLLALLSLGEATPLFSLSRTLPFGSWFRVPMRFLNLLPLCVSLLAAAGADRAFGRGETADRKALLSCTALFWITVLLACGGGAPLGAWVLAFSLALLPALLLLLLSRFPRGRAAAPFLLAGTCGAVPLLLYQPHILSPSRIDDLYTPLAAPLRAAGEPPSCRVLSLVPLTRDRMWAKMGSFFSVPVLNDFEPLSLKDFALFSNALSGRSSAPFDVFTGDVAPPKEHFDTRLLDLAGVRWVIADEANEPRLARWFENPGHLVPRERHGVVRLYENTGARPRAWFVPGAGVRRSPVDCTGTLLSGQFNDRTEALVDREAGPPSQFTGSGNVRLVSHRPDEVILESRSEGPGLVLLTDAAYPGWLVTVDGRAATGVRADCFFRGVAVDAGAHRIVWQYRPASFRLGLLLSLVTAAGMALGAFAPRLRRA